MCVARDPRRFQARQTKNPTTRIWDRKGLLPEFRDRVMSDTISREADIAEKIQIRPVFDTIACYSFAPLTARFLRSLTDAAPTSVSAQKTQPQLEGHNCPVRTLEVAKREWLFGSRRRFSLYPATVRKAQPNRDHNLAIQRTAHCTLCT